MSVIYLKAAGGVLVGPVALLEVPGIGFQTPDDAIALDTELAVPPPGYAWALVSGVPALLADHRGPVYSTETSVQQMHDALGELPEGLTTAPPPGQFYVWQAGAWVLDLSAQLADQAATALSERDSRLRTAAIRIAPLQDAQDLDMASPSETAALLKWKRYRVDLNRIEQQASYPQAIEWPVPPVVTATT